MDSSETNLTKCCSNCKVINVIEKFVIGRNLCKDCRNIKTKNEYNNIIIDNKTEQKCNDCCLFKNITEFYKGRKICSICTSSKRREKYTNDETYRLRVINATLKCKKGKPGTPLQNFKRCIRTRIYRLLENKNKTTSEYLGCSRDEYIKWLLNNTNNYNLENRGKEWHIDHIIPLSHFNLEDEQQQLIAFNWRNTMPLSVTENLKKGNKIIKEQVEQHYKKIVEYHLENKLDLPQVFIDLFAKHLVDGNTLKLSLPLTSGNLCEELS